MIELRSAHRFALIGGVAVGAIAGAIGFNFQRAEVANLYESEFEEWAQQRDAARAGTIMAFPGVSDKAAHNHALTAMAPASIGAALLIGGATSMRRLGTGALGLAIAGVGLLGLGAGIALGTTRGVRASQSRNGIDIADQADTVVAEYDTDGNFAIDRRGTAERLAESIRLRDRRSPGDQELFGPYDESITATAQAADTNLDFRVDSREIEQLFSKYDFNGDSLLSAREARSFEHDGLEQAAYAIVR